MSFDLPAVEPIAQRWIAREADVERVRTASGDFLKEPLPKAGVIMMSMILHDWNLEKNKAAGATCVRRVTARRRLHRNRKSDRRRAAYLVDVPKSAANGEGTLCWRAWLATAED